MSYRPYQRISHACICTYIRTHSFIHYFDIKSSYKNTDVTVFCYTLFYPILCLLCFLPQNFAVELQLENMNEFEIDHFREHLLRAGGANYGTGMRDP